MFDRAELESVSGEIELLATLRPAGDLVVKAHSGDVGSLLAQHVDATVELKTFSGDLHVDGAGVSASNNPAGPTATREGRAVAEWWSRRSAATSSSDVDHDP